MPPPCVSLSLSLRVLLWSGSNWCLARLLPSSPLQFSDQEVGDQRSSNWTVAAAGSGTPISPSSTGHRDVRYPRRQRAVAYLIDDTGMWGVRVGCFFRQEPLLRYERKGSSQVDLRENGGWEEQRPTVKREEEGGGPVEETRRRGV